MRKGVEKKEKNIEKKISILFLIWKIKILHQKHGDDEEGEV